MLSAINSNSGEIDLSFCISDLTEINNESLATPAPDNIDPLIIPNYNNQRNYRNIKKNLKKILDKIDVNALLNMGYVITNTAESDELHEKNIATLRKLINENTTSHLDLSLLVNDINDAIKTQIRKINNTIIDIPLLERLIKTNSKTNCDQNKIITDNTVINNNNSIKISSIQNRLPILECLIGENKSINCEQASDIKCINNKLPILENKIQDNTISNVKQDEHIMAIENKLPVLENLINENTSINFTQTANIECINNKLPVLENKINTNKTDICHNSSLIATNTSGISSNSGLISTNTNNITSHSNLIATNTSDIVCINNKLPNLQDKIIQNCDDNDNQDIQISLLQQTFENYPTPEELNQQLLVTAELITQLQDTVNNFTTSVSIDGDVITFVSSGDDNGSGSGTITIDFGDINFNIYSLRSDHNYLDVSMEGGLFPDNFIKEHADGSGSGKFTFYMSVNPSFESTTMVSDRRLKKNIYTLENCLQKINSMRGVEWNWKKNDKRSTGVIAQELMKIDTDLIDTSKEMMSVNYNALTGYFIEAIKEQTIIQTRQHNKINELEQKLQNQQKEIDIIKSQIKL